MPSTIAVVSAFETAMTTALSVTVKMGLPEVGRVAITYPLGAVLFDNDDYNTSAIGLQKKTIGQDQAHGTTFTANLYLFAADEYNLFTLIDALRTVKGSAAGLTVSGTKVIVRFGPTQRTQVFETDKVVENTIVTPVTFSW